MKLLGWMHRKLKQSSTGEVPFKELGIGQPSLDDQEYYQKYYYGPRPSKSQKENLLRKSSFNGRSGESEEYYLEEEYSDDVESDYFNGLLTIGTLGSDTIMMEPGTPTFPFTGETVTDNVTENDLRLINEELEKVLAADVKDDKWTDSSGRTSHVSTITLSATDGIGNVTAAVCPLQGYLFGAPEHTVVKKENRTSLGELLQKTKLGEEIGEKEEKRGEKEGENHKSAKKKLIRKILGSSADSVSAEKKLTKILQMFHKKVHPEGVVTTKKSSKLNKTDSRNNIQHGGGGYASGDYMLPDEDITTSHKVSVSKDFLPRFKSNSNPPHYAIDRSDSNVNREYWIKTDADYLVLEL
ncbi:Lazy-like protein [Thalictrum thalictroides]|uniref:Lazy-like protein n=1 Tax=Thalictrum thalictroides TaxID=46969 RepID=A0A7J6X6V0_THATH|nr:Lazy-like protein [Thalictrum thalictroides]